MRRRRGLPAARRLAQRRAAGLRYYKVEYNESSGCSIFDTSTGVWKQHELNLFDSAAPRVRRAPGKLAGYIIKLAIYPSTSHTQKLPNPPKPSLMLSGIEIYTPDVFLGSFGKVIHRCTYSRPGSPGTRGGVGPQPVGMPPAPQSTVGLLDFHSHLPSFTLFDSLFAQLRMIDVNKPLLCRPIWLTRGYE